MESQEQSQSKAEVVATESTHRLSDEFPLSGGAHSKHSISEKLPDTTKHETRPRKEKLYLLFLSYAEVSEESGVSALKPRQFVKLLTDSSIIDAAFNRTKAEMIFKSSAGKKVMDFDSFTNSILRISEAKFKDLPKADAAEQLVSKHLLPLYSLLCTGRAEGGEVAPLAVVHRLAFTSEIKRMLNSVGGVLQSIYKNYIGKVLITAKTEDQVLRIITRDLLALLRDFDILRNNLVTKQAVAVMLNALVNTPDQEFAGVLEDPGLKCGTMFTFDRFLVFLYWISVVGFDVWSQTTVQYTPAEKTYYLLARMEFSKGLNKRQPYSVQSLVPPADVVKSLVKNNPWNEKSQFEQKTEDEKDEGQRECIEKLHKLFVAYCPISATSNINKMPLFKYLAFLKDCGLINPSLEPNRKTLTTTEAELLFTKVIKSSNEKMLDLSKELTFSPVKKAPQSDIKKDKLDFDSFHYILSQIATKFYPSETPGKSLLELFNNSISSLSSEENSDLKSLLEESGVPGVLELLKKALITYIQPYKDTDGIMDYDGFIKFCKDFGIFPELCSKPLLRFIFYSFTFARSEKQGEAELSKSLKSEEKKAVVKAKEYISDDAMIEALGICALKSCAFEGDAEPVDKILHLAEKMARSQGTAKVKKMTGVTRLTADDSDFLGEMRVRYKEYFAKKRQTSDQSSVLSKILTGNNTGSP